MLIWFFFTEIFRNQVQNTTFATVSLFMKSWIPNLLTLSNLFFGCCALVLLFNDEPELVFVCVLLSNVADFLDGWLARKLGVDGELGKQLDSLADVVSFGVLPAAMMYHLLLLSVSEANSSIAYWLPFAGFLIAAFSALRLAIFNLDLSQSSSFRGLPTPANALWITGCYMSLVHGPDFLASALDHTWLLILLTGLSCFLLVSPIRLIKLKPGSPRTAAGLTLWVLLTAGIVLFIFLREAALTASVLLYILLSLALYNRQSAS